MKGLDWFDFSNYGKTSINLFNKPDISKETINANMDAKDDQDNSNFFKK